MHRALFPLLALLLLATSPLASLAQPAAAAKPSLDAARAPIESFYAALDASMKAGDSLAFDARKKQLEPVVVKTFDLPLMAAKVLGRHWKSLAPADQKRWAAAFAGLTVKTYAEQFDENSGLVFEIGAVQAAPGGTALVRTKLKRANDDPVAIDYRMRPAANGWRIMDIFLNGTVSELALRRSEYSSVLERDGFEKLVVTLQNRSLVPASHAKK
ncbi:MAG: ABC transporter substrate-binding protein [Deltaproteobacteria bacterium]|nr:ABC transporter substrate-binding protein [Deltaproteobacteria bacterium]